MNLETLRSGNVPDTWKGDGIIGILGSNSLMDAALLKKKTPIVNIGPDCPDAVPKVMPNNTMIGQLAVDHFASRGFRHYAYYRLSGGPSETLRLEGFKAALAKRNFTTQILDVPAFEKRRPTSDVTRMRWLAASIKVLPKPLAIFAEFDDPAVEIIQACELAGIPIPEQVAVLGADNDELRCDFAPVALSSIDDDQHQQGYQAAALLERIMLGEAPPRQPILISPKKVVTRQSSDILAIKHPLVAAVLRTIWEHYTEPIDAGEIPPLFPMSARRLHDAFCKHVGHSVAEELFRKRIERSKQLLVSTDQKLHDIADKCGFSSSDHLSKVFRRREGLSPSEYRLANRRPGKRT